MSRGETGRRPSPTTMRRALLAWFDRHRRDLPWRATRDPYAIWISEVMLQQTRADVVMDRYRRFLSRFPSLAELAASSEEEVLAEWSGLGYYGRARNLHAAARAVVARHGGIFPSDLAQTLALPGIGTYSAHAILSIAHGLPLAVVDGNVSRVLSRLSLLPARPQRIIQQEADRLLSPDRPGDANQALMELGAITCLPRTPRCGDCPLRRICGARATNQTDRFPAPSRKPRVSEIATTIWVLRDGLGRIWLEKRSDPPLRGIWMLPWREGSASPARRARLVGIVPHAIMSRRYRCEILEADIPPERIPGAAAGQGRWVRSIEIESLPHSSLLTKALRAAEAGSA